MEGMNEKPSPAFSLLSGSQSLELPGTDREPEGAGILLEPACRSSGLSHTGNGREQPAL